jgi:hypothetical protein
MILKTFFYSLVSASCFIAILSGCQKAQTTPVHVPKVYADSSRTITLPVDSVRLNGSATDTGGRVVAWLWSEVSGPNVPVIHTEGSPSTTISGLTAGVYVFQLMVLDSAGGTGVGKVTITVNPAISTQVLSTFFEWGRYESHWQGNSTQNLSDPNAPELSAITWTRNGDLFYGRDAFVFNMSSLPAGLPVKSARLSLYSNHNPINGDQVNANSGSTNAFYISRINSAWDHATTSWANQPGIDTTGQVLIPQTNQSFLDVTDVDVTKMVNKMISTGNYGFKIQLQTEQIYNSRIFYSSIASDSTKRPRLVVSY